MMDFPTHIADIFLSRAPVAVVFYEDPDARARLLKTIELLMPDDLQPVRTSDVEDAFRHLDKLLLLTPDNELEALRALAGRRDALIERSAPTILFLLRRGSASALFSSTQLAGLASWLRGHIVDPVALQQINPTIERQRFAEATGQEPEAWLRAFRAGELSDTIDNQLWHSQALLLAEKQHVSD